MEKQTLTGSRPTTVEELENVYQLFFDPTEEQLGLAFKPRPSDIIISPYAKCGTTWLQQITHQLRTRGSMDFDEINNVSPWLEVAFAVGYDLEAEQEAFPRLYKSHASWHDIPKECRYICSFRHPYDAMVSFYRFFEGWYFEPGSIDMDTLARWRWPRDQAGEKGYWYHLTSWWEQRHNPDVLLICFEDMKADPADAVKKIARFMEIDLDEELLEIVLAQTSLEFMLMHKDQFGEHKLQKMHWERAGLPPAIEVSKVTPGSPNKARYQLSPALKQELDEIWQEQVESRFGYKNYEELRQAVNELPN